MKHQIIKTTKSFLNTIGDIAGRTFSIMPTIIRKYICVLCAGFTHAVPQKLYFLVYEFTKKITDRLFNVSDSEVFVCRKLYPGFKMMLDISKRTQRQIYLSDIYEPHISRYLFKNLNKGEVFVDIGANVGYYTLMASLLVGVDGCVVAFEPETGNFNRLKKNSSLNGYKNILAFNNAVGDEGGSKTLNLNPFNEGGHSLNTFEYYKSNKAKLSPQDVKEKYSSVDLQQTVEVVQLDNFVKGLELAGTPSIIKIDVEGFELNVLSGMKQILSNPVSPHVICEVSQKKKQIFEYMSSLGYKAYLIDNQGDITVALDTNAKRDYLFKR